MKAFIRFITCILPLSVIYGQSYLMHNDLCMKNNFGYNISQLGSWESGLCFAIDTIEDYICFGQGNYFRIMDISNLNEPKILGSLELEYCVEEIKIDKNLAFIKAVKYGWNNQYYLILVNISDIQNPTILSTNDLGKDWGHWPGHYILKNGYLFILNADYQLDWNSWIEIYSYNDPINLVKLGQTDYFEGWYHNIDVEDSLIFTSDGRGYLTVLDILDVEHPTFVGRFNLNCQYEEFDIVGSILYLAADNGLFKIMRYRENKVDELSTLNLDEDDFFNKKIIVDNKYAYLIGGNSFIVINIENNLEPIKVLEATIELKVQVDMKVKNGMVYFADLEKGISVYDAKEISSFREIFNFNTGDFCREIIINNGYAYVGHNEEKHGYSILNVSDPINPLKIGQLNESGNWDLDNIVFHEKYAYVLNESFKIYDLTSIENPILLNQFDDLKYGTMAIDNNNLFVAKDSLYVFDISNPTKPMTQGFCAIIDTSKQWIIESTKIKIKDNHAFILGREGTWSNVYSVFTIVNVEDKNNPYILNISDSSYHGSGNKLLDLYFMNNYAIVGWLASPLSDLPVNPYCFIDIVEISDLANPKLTEIELFTDLEERKIDNIYFHNDLMYLIRSDNLYDGTSENSYLEIYEFVNYKTVNQIASYPLKHQVEDIEVDNDIIYLVLDSQVLILRMDLVGSNNSEMEKLDSYILNQNYPNPFNPNTIIKYSIPKLSNVTLKVFDVLGSEVATLVNKEQLNGNYEVEFKGNDLTSGLYFYRLQAGEFVETKKMIFLK